MNAMADGPRFGIQATYLGVQSFCILHSPQAYGTCGPKSMEPMSCREWTPLDPPATRRTVVFPSAASRQPRERKSCPLGGMFGSLSRLRKTIWRGLRLQFQRLSIQKVCKSAHLFISLTSITAGLDKSHKLLSVNVCCLTCRSVSRHPSTYGPEAACTIQSN